MGFWDDMRREYNNHRKGRCRDVTGRVLAGWGNNPANIDCALTGDVDRLIQQMPVMMVLSFASEVEAAARYVEKVQALGRDGGAFEFARRVRVAVDELPDRFKPTGPQDGLP